MDFALSDSSRDLVHRVRKFVDDIVLPTEPQLLTQPFADLAPALQTARIKARSQGLWLPQVSTELGGMGLSVLEHALISEQLGRSPLGHYALNCQAPDADNMGILTEFGTDDQKQRWLMPLLHGETRSCFSMTEPDRPGSNPAWMMTRARRDDGDWLIDGHKWFTSAADGAAFAIVMAVTNDRAHPHRRASMLIVPTDNPGFHLVRNIAVMGHAGSGWTSHAEIRYENCRVPETNLLGQEGDGFVIAQAGLGPGRVQHCMRWIGICQRAFDMMCERAATRLLTPTERLGNRQTVQNWIAECRADIDAARLMVLHAAWQIDHEGNNAARAAVSLIKFHVAAVLTRVLNRAIQTHGALGVTNDTVLAHFYRHERGAHIYDGPDEVHKTVVARQLLQNYGPDETPPAP